MTYILQKENAGVLTLTLNNPEKLNALSDTMMTELDGLLVAADKNDKIKVVLLHGAGRGFSAGANIGEMAAESAKGLAEKNFITKNWEGLARFSKPTMAAVHGFAFGGGLELAMMADVMFATADCALALPEVTLAVMPGAGGSQRLPKLLPPQLAHYMILTGEKITGATAEQFGMVAKTFPAESILGEVEKIAQKIATYSLPALQAIKSSLRDAAQLPLAEGIAKERQRFYSLFDTAEQKLAMQKFLHKK